jgi:hypothetical protein
VQAQAVLKKDAGIHAGEHRNVPPWAHREIPEREIVGKIFVGFQQFISD